MRTFHVCLLIIPLMLAEVPQAIAQLAITFAPNATISNLPTTGGYSRRNGMALTFNPQWSNNYGYHPVQVTVRSFKPLATDRSLVFQMRGASWDQRYGGIAVQQEAVFPAGKTQIVMTVDVPAYQQYLWISGGYYSWDLLVDGVRDKELSIDQNYGGFSSGGSQMPELSVLVVGLPVMSRLPVMANTTRYELLYLPVADLPTRWIEYTALDVVTISVADLQAAAKSNPQALTAIRRWLRSGGHLWVGDAGQKWERLAAAEQLLGLSAAPADPEGEAGEGMTDEEAAKRGWKSIRPWPENWDGRRVTYVDQRNQSKVEALDPLEIARYGKDPNYTILEERRENVSNVSAAERQKNKAANDSIDYFVERPVAFGKIRLFRGDEMLKVWKTWQQGLPSTVPVVDANGNVIGTTMQQIATPQGATQTITALPEPRSVMMAMESSPNWSVRHGLMPDMNNGEFVDWLLPGVGLAPVTEFRILITLFVLVIGPLNYILLKRFRRLHLLVITVPLAAVLLTIALFVYALAVDGLGTKVRVRSVTLLDQRAGEAASWARLSYYAGVAPGGGLLMSADTAVYPILPDWYSGGNAQIGDERHLVWDGDQARLTQGWLRSRTPTQYLTVRSQNSALRLQLRTGDGRMSVKNELAADIHYLVVADAEGNLFSGEELANDASAELQPSDRIAASMKMATLVRDNMPQPPPELGGYGRSQIANSLLINQRYSSSYAYRYGNTAAGRLSDNLMQEALVRWTTLDSDANSGLKPRSYVAVTKTNPEVELGVKGAHEEDSFHVIIGQW